MINITLCDKVLDGDVPQYKFDKKDEAISFVYEWLREKDFFESVFVVFESWRDLDIEHLRNEQTSLLISHDWDSITDKLEADIETAEELGIDFCIFEFENYQEALKYCIDLKESF